jgi:uncharacterized damage-inducible protein DinB
MSDIPAWFERRFDFSFPVELLPNICARLRGTPARLEEILRDQPRNTLTGRTHKQWSAQEQAGHMADLEPLWRARVNDYTANRNELTVADLTNSKTQEANHNARGLAEILAEFRAARETLLQTVLDLDDAARSRSIPHPRLKIPMRLVDHLYFVAEHDDHHLARIWELISRSRSRHE